jgi:DNA-binding MarR family transcriptional regulator
MFGHLDEDKGASAQYEVASPHCQPGLHSCTIFPVTAGSRTSEIDARADGLPARSSVGIGPGLRRAWVGYQHRLDEAMAAAGFDDRRFPDGRVLRLCTNPGGSTISAIGRELGITRQGAGKVVRHLEDHGYVSVVDSATSGREKSVTPTPRGAAYLAARGKAARTIDSQLRAQLGQAGFSALHALLDSLGRGEEVRMRDHLRRANMGTSDSQED